MSQVERTGAFSSYVFEGSGDVATLQPSARLDWKMVERISWVNGEPVPERSIHFVGAEANPTLSSDERAALADLDSRRRTVGAPASPSPKDSQ